MMVGTSSGTIQHTLANRMPPSRVLNDIHVYSKKYSIPHEILLGIYLIEIHGRPFWFRSLEYFLLTLHIVYWFLSRQPIPNYTIGRFQLGLATILKYYGYAFNPHSRFIKLTNFRQISLIIRSIYWKSHLEIASELIKEIYEECSDLDYGRQCRYIGIKYNGHISYGLFLEKLVRVYFSNQEPLNK